MIAAEGILPWDPALKNVKFFVPRTVGKNVTRDMTVVKHESSDQCRSPNK